jgi:hypothetical protein
VAGERDCLLHELSVKLQLGPGDWALRGSNPQPYGCDAVLAAQPKTHANEPGTMKQRYFKGFTRFVLENLEESGDIRKVCTGGILDGFSVRNSVREVSPVPLL